MDVTKRLNPTKTALLVIDKQGGYFDPELVQGRLMQLPSNAPRILENIEQFIENARLAEVEVIWTQMVENTQDSPIVTSELMKADPDSVFSISKQGTPSFEIFGRVMPSPGEKVLTKYYYNAFAKTDLAAYLHERNIETVILVGGYAPRCVLATAIGANGNDLFVVIVKDAVSYQKNTEQEIPGLFFFTNTLLGSALNSNEICKVWDILV